MHSAIPGVLRNIMNEIRFCTITPEHCARIKPLWIALRTCLIPQSTWFSGVMKTLTFEERMNAICNKTVPGEIRIEIAYDVTTGCDIGYCISTILSDRTAEIDSIYVVDSYQNQGIGSDLIMHAKKWMTENGAGIKRVVVTYGNEEVLQFYEKLGFLPRFYLLEEGR